MGQLTPQERAANVDRVMEAAEQLEQVENYLADIQARANAMGRIVTECRATINSVMKAAKEQQGR